DARFDAVLSTLMLHHLPPDAQRQCAREVRRVMKPGGRVLVVDFGPPEPDRWSLFERFHRHHRIDVRAIITLLGGAGLEIVESGALGVLDLNFVLARAR